MKSDSAANCAGSASVISLASAGMKGTSLPLMPSALASPFTIQV